MTEDCVACPVMANHIRVALVGQPNVGKSMLINSVSNAHLHVGNFSGVTVDKTEVLFDYEDYHFTVVDLPGSYALNDYSIEEKVTSTFLFNGDFDIIVNVVDSTNLEKNMQLTAELMSMNKKMVMALNMSDEAEKEGIDIDEAYLSKLLGINCTKVSAVTRLGIDELIKSVISTFEQDKTSGKLVFSEAIEEEIDNVVSLLNTHKYQAPNSYRNVAINILKDNKRTYERMIANPIWTEVQPVLLEAKRHIELHHDTDDVKEAFAEEYASFNRGVVAEILNDTPLSEKRTMTEKIDSILINQYFGIPIFLFFMWSLFQLTFELGAIPMDMIDGFFGWLGDVVGATISNDDIRSLIVDGLIGGVGAVVLFVPNIIILFIGIALLESTGYMSRVAFLLDGFFHKFGLHGQSFIPLVTGFGCSIPAYMSARILKNDRDRLLTLFIIGFMSCGARLPVYVLFAGAFFSEEMAGNILFLIYISGAIIGLFAAKLLKLTAFKGEDEPFVMEMPKYRLPSLKLVWHTVSNKTWMYLKKAGTFIAAAAMLVWFMSNYPKNLELNSQFESKISALSSQKEITLVENKWAEQRLEQSYLGEVGKFIAPVFEPIGLDWKMSVSILTGLAAKEVVVSTLGVLYSLGDAVDEESSSLKALLASQISFASAMAFIVIIMIYLPCLAASIVFTREAGHIKYFFYLLGFTSIAAYILAFITYQVALLF